MSALVHLPNGTRIKLHMRPEPAEGFVAISTKTKFGVEFRAQEGMSPVATLLSGKEAGNQVGAIGPNQRAVLSLGIFSPYKYQAIVAINPAFNQIATVVGPQIVEPKEETLLDLVINAHKEVKLSEFTWFARVYMFE